MQPQNELALVVSFYLSKFDYDGLARLGYDTFREAFRDIGQKLDVKPTSVKNMRDEFDPFYDNKRRGWYQKEIRPSRRRVIATFDDLSEEALRALVLDIIRPEANRKVQIELQPVLREIRNSDKPHGKRQPLEYVPRGLTGRRAEEFFISRFYSGLTPFTGQLLDRRDDGVGFDFEITTGDSSISVEIKGLAKEIGGITFTDKEWKVANEMRANYYLGLVANLPRLPQIGFIQNPATQFKPSYYLHTAVIATWGVGADQLRMIELI